MNEVTENLVALTKCEEALRRLQREREAIPKVIAERNARQEAARQALEAERTTLEEAESLGRAKEAELQDTEVLRSKYQSQTSMVKTNQEYTALLEEIEGATRRIGEIEEAILEAMEKVETVGAHLSTFQAEHKKREQETEREIKELNDRLVEVEREIEVRSGEEQERVSRLERKTQSLYHRVKSKAGFGTARVEGHVCGACHRDVPFEVINRMLAGELHDCGNCRRILVIVPETEA